MATSQDRLINDPSWFDIQEAAIIQVELVRWLNYRDPSCLATISQALHDLDRTSNPNGDGIAKLCYSNGLLMAPWAQAAVDLRNDLERSQ